MLPKEHLKFKPSYTNHKKPFTNQNTHTTHKYRINSGKLNFQNYKAILWHFFLKLIQAYNVKMKLCLLYQGRNMLNKCTETISKSRHA